MAECSVGRSYERSKCDNCGAVALPACPHCLMHLCQDCADGGVHDFCLPESKQPRGSHDRSTAPDSANIRNVGQRRVRTFVEGAEIPTEPHFGRKLNHSRYLIDQDTPEMECIMHMARMNLARMDKLDRDKDSAQGSGHRRELPISANNRIDREPFDEEIRPSDPRGDRIRPSDSVSRTGSQEPKAAAVPLEPPPPRTKDVSGPDVRKPGDGAATRSGRTTYSSWDLVSSQKDSTAHHHLNMDLNSQCGICSKDFLNGQRCVRLQCRHMFHQHCWQHVSLRDSWCPICQGAGKEIAIWDFVGQSSVDTQVIGDRPVPNLLGASASQACSDPGSRMVRLVSPFEFTFHDPRSRSNTPPPSRRSPTPTLGPRDDRDVSAGTGTNKAVPPSEVATAAPTYFPIMPTTDQDSSNWVRGCETSYRQTGNGTADNQESTQETYQCSEVKLADGRLALMLDIGSVGNLCGSKWAQAVALFAKRFGRRSNSIKRDRPLSVSGVGTGAQECHYNTHVPCAIPANSGVVKGTFKAPCVPDSELPALLGLLSLHNSRGIIDTINNRLYLVGPGDFDLEKALPPGSKMIQCEYAVTGHMMMPITAYEELDKEEKGGGLVIEKEVVLPASSKQS